MDAVILDILQSIVTYTEDFVRHIPQADGKHGLSGTSSDVCVSDVLNKHKKVENRTKNTKHGESQKLAKKQSDSHGCFTVNCAP